MDGPGEMLILCDVDRRSPTHGIHHINASMEIAKNYLLDGNVMADAPDHELGDLDLDTKLSALWQESYGLIVVVKHRACTERPFERHLDLPHGAQLDVAVWTFGDPFHHDHDDDRFRVLGCLCPKE